LTLRISLKEPWPDFMTFYGTTATAAGLVVPKKYVQQVGDDGFRKHPIGAGPYKFVSHSPGVEIVLEAYTGYWRRVPNVKRLVMKSVPEGTTRVAMLKKGEADIAYSLDGEDAENVRRDPFKGLGKPEPLKGSLAGFWSRRVTGEHRLVYEVAGKGEAQQDSASDS
jgi:peptide/nickel transport system substrate-binding protein